MVLAPCEDSGEQLGELIPPLLTALSASSGAGPERGHYRFGAGGNITSKGGIQ